MQARTREKSAAARLRFLLRPSLAVGLVYTGLLLLFVVWKGYGALDFVHLGSVWAAGDPSGDWGYDGQFYYQIARDPAGAAPFLDNAPFRYQRMLYPLAARLLSGGQPNLIPYTLLAVNWLAIVLGVELLSRLLQRQQLSPWYSLAYGLYFGQATALTFDTTEPFTNVWLCLAIWLFSRQQKTLAALSFGLAAVSRETAVLFPLAFLAFFLARRRWQEAQRFALLGVCPLLVWLLLLALYFGETGVTFTPPLETLPFYGIFHHVAAPRKFWLLVLLMLLPTALCGVLALHQLLRRPLHPLLLAWLAHVLLVTFLSRYSYLELISSGRHASALVLAFIAYAASVRSRPLLLLAQVYAGTFAVYLPGVLLGWQSLIP